MSPSPPRWFYMRSSGSAGPRKRHRINNEVLDKEGPVPPRCPLCFYFLFFSRPRSLLNHGLPSEARDRARAAAPGGAGEDYSAQRDLLAAEARRAANLLLA